MQTWPVESLASLRNSARWSAAAQGEKQTMDFLYLRGRTVRYIHLPGTLNPAAAIEAHRRAAAEALATHRRHGQGWGAGTRLWFRVEQEYGDDQASWQARHDEGNMSKHRSRESSGRLRSQSG